MFNKKANSRFDFKNKLSLTPKSKRSQGEIITTVLIILLVLAAIVIVWQVVNSTVKKGSEAVDTQSDCLGLSIELSEATPGGAIVIKPNKDISGYRIYFNGAIQGTPVSGVYPGDTIAVGAFATVTTTYNPAATVIVTSAAKIGSQWCNGLNEFTATG